ncbi:hypothetical protein GALL_461270 [mine drainage metagenome]|uniref:Uncharacterized protein n=1 Tax=mine drainage metagenome TaxID=410659 RepID=A0A1J5PWP7_9ZZZZ
MNQLCADTGRLWIEKLTFDVTAPSTARSPNDAVAEVQELMAQIATEDGFRNAARQELEQMLALLPQARRAALAPDPAAQAMLLDQLAADAILAMTAAMLGANEDDVR